ncbi:MAG: hypothetical protein DCC57_07140 [Chloroflexi bacterium]|nr:MAG: hypothetical protein DCC57_07140 [Chloroflexota bacterium]
MSALLTTTPTFDGSIRVGVAVGAGVTPGRGVAVGVRVGVGVAVGGVAPGAASVTSSGATARTPVSNE